MKTLNVLISEGNRLLEKEESEMRREEEERENKRQRSWLGLREQAIIDLGEIAAKIPTNAPKGFNEQTYSYRFDFRPFGDVELFVRYEEINGFWSLTGVPFTVQTDFASGKGSDPKPEPCSWEDSTCLSRAVALCFRAQKAYENVQASPSPSPLRRCPVEQ